jgi:iron complex outermembrane receptor protein
VSGGFLANWNTQVGRLWNIYPGIDASWNFTDKIKWYISLNKSLRVPTFTDLYYSSPTNKGNPALKPEEATGFETGLKYNKNNGLSAHLTYFHRWGKNMIDWIKAPEETIWHAANITALNTDGIEIFAKMNFEKIYQRPLFIKYLNIAYSYLDQGKESGEYSSKYVLDYLKHKVDIGVTLSLLWGISADWKLSYQDRNGTYTEWQGTKYGEEVAYAPVWLLDSKLSWNKGGTTVYLEGSNLLNKRYMDYANVELPGIWFKMGIMFQMNL